MHSHLLIKTLFITEAMYIKEAQYIINVQNNGYDSLIVPANFVS